MEGIEKLSQYFEENQEYCYRVAYHYTQNSELAKDALQEAIIKAMVHYSQLRNEKYMKTWFYRILINECYCIMRREKRVVALEDYRQEEKAEERQDYSELYEAIYRLPEEMRLSVTLYYLEGYSVREIAAMTEATESAVKNRLARARQRLRTELTGQAAQ